MKEAKKIGYQYFTGILVSSVLCIAMATTGLSSDFAPGELLVQPRGEVSDEQLDAIFKSHNIKVVDTLPQIHVKLLKVAPYALEQVKSALSGNPAFNLVEKNFLAAGASIPNDTYYSSQWHLAQISAPMGWDISTGASNVPIAIIDSGVDPAHPDLSAKLLAGYNCLDDTTDTADVLGHGTAVAGSAAALSNNATGVAGVAWNNPIMPLVVLNSSNLVSYSNIAKAIIYAADQGIRVINISMGGPNISSTLQNAVDYAWNKGAMIFASAMNYATSDPCYPAACNNAVAVSATTPGDTIASFSNYGDWIDIAAPGLSIATTNKGGSYGNWSGTSFSSPISAGLAALILSVNPALTNAQVVALMENNADDLGDPGFDSYYGHGRINAYKSLAAAKNTEALLDTISPTVSVTSPLYGTTVSNTTSVRVSATDNAGVSRVELYISGTLFGTDTTEPFDFFWNTAQYPDGTYSIEAHAYDLSGNSGISDTVLVNVNNPKDMQPPFVSISSPENNAYVRNFQQINAVATDDVSINIIELYIDDTLIILATEQTTLSYLWNTRKIARGPHVITAKAYDTAGNLNTDSITVYK